MVPGSKELHTWVRFLAAKIRCPPPGPPRSAVQSEYLHPCESAANQRQHKAGDPWEGGDPLGEGRVQRGVWPLGRRLERSRASATLRLCRKRRRETLLKAGPLSRLATLTETHAANARYAHVHAHTHSQLHRHTTNGSVGACRRPSFLSGFPKSTWQHLLVHPPLASEQHIRELCGSMIDDQIAQLAANLRRPLAPGMVGRPGPPGPPGKPGTMGSIGHPGAHGPPGYRGLPGELGDPGPRGDVGEQGDKGPTGKTIDGPHGDQGYQGLPGVPGIVKDGRDGSPGDPGLPGEPGRVGRTGHQGPPGICDTSACQGTSPAGKSSNPKKN